MPPEQSSSHFSFVFLYIPCPRRRAAVCRWAVGAAGAGAARGPSVRRGGARSGAERGREAGVTGRERGRGRGAREAGASRGASQRPPRGVGPLPFLRRYVHGRKPRKSPLLSSPSTWVPGRARSSCRGAQQPPALSLLPRRRDLQASTREFSNKSRRCAPLPAGFLWNRRCKNKQCVLGRSHARDECTTRGQARDVGAPRPSRSFLGVRSKSRSACTVVPPRESRRLSASLARLLYLEQGNFRL